MSCRFCFGEDNLIDLGCLCKGKSHVECASKWFFERLDLTISGKITSSKLDVTVSCKCEICNSLISEKLCDTILRMNKSRLKNLFC